MTAAGAATCGLGVAGVGKVDASMRGVSEFACEAAALGGGVTTADAGADAITAGGVANDACDGGLSAVGVAPHAPVIAAKSPANLVFLCMPNLAASRPQRTLVLPIENLVRFLS